MGRVLECCGREIPYYEVAVAAAKAIQDGRAGRGILFCGTGMGMAIVANKHEGIVAAVVESVYAAKMSRAINNANVLSMGAMLVAPWKAQEMVNVWLKTRHTESLEQFEGFLKKAVEEVRKVDRAEHAGG